MSRNVYVNGSLVLSKQCDKDAECCPDMQHIALNKYVVQNNNSNDVRLKVYYIDTTIKNLKTICDNCSKQRE